MEVIRRAFNNPHFARTNGDKLASMGYVVGGIFTIWYELIVVMRSYHASVNAVTAIHFAIGMWAYIGAMSNWYKLISTRTYAYYVELQSQQNTDWKYCDICFGFCPPRGHHCKVCNVCIIKRDHHCWFAGTCIGYSNHRYYFNMVLYIWFSALYSNIYNYAFVTEELEGLSMGTVFCILFPHVGALFGMLTLRQFFLCMVSLMGFICLVMFTWLLQIQLTQAWAGQTKHERKQGIREYDVGLRGNLVEILGHRWYLAWASVLVRSRPPGDGITFTKQVKDQ